MPDFRDLLSSAAMAHQPSQQPTFESIQKRSLRRVHRRRSVGVAAVAAVTVGGGVAVASSGGSRSAVPGAVPASPCTSPYPTTYPYSSDDVFVAIPTSGTVHVTVQPSRYVTVGWPSCTETGTITSDDVYGEHLSSADPKAHTLAVSGHTPDPGVTGVQRQISYRTLHQGTVTLVGKGSQGSHGTVVVTVGFPAEPVGNSAPSAYPADPDYNTSGFPDVCDATDFADASGRLTKSVSYEGGSKVVSPAGALKSKYTRDEILEKTQHGDFRLTEGTVHVYFGLLTGDTPAHINKDGTATPLDVKRPVWLAVVCDAPPNHPLGGPFSLPHATPAPGTSPSPSAEAYGGFIEPYFDSNGKPEYEELTGRESDAQKAERFIDVPYTRNHEDSADGRQIGISYTAGKDCASFDHLDVSEQDDAVYVRVWLHITGTSCATDTTHTAVVGLIKPLGTRKLIRGTYSP